MNILVLALVLIMASTVVQYQINAFGETFTLTPPGNTIKVNGTSFAIPYTIAGGTITLIQADTDAKTIDVSVQSQNGGSLTITLPTRLINAYQGAAMEPEYMHDTSGTAHFIVTSKNHGAQYTEVDTSENRTLTIPFSSGSSTIEIKGTYMVPEFGSMVSITLAIAIVSIIVVSSSKS
ncbi:MAG: PEFG-CTERM sorting domain-containing protein [Thaumarchaeota archaeon]|nr:PEFG-CTERM sorting domain-containing protein [Nitrososphaerota archaeon]